MVRPWLDTFSRKISADCQRPLAGARLCNASLIPRDFLLSHDRKRVVIDDRELNFALESS